MAGAWELPVLARGLLERGGVEALVALGAVIRGETVHFEIIAGECARGLMALAVRVRRAGRLRGADLRHARSRRSSAPAAPRATRATRPTAAALDAAAALPRARWPSGLRRGPAPSRSSCSYAWDQLPAGGRSARGVGAGAGAGDGRPAVRDRAMGLAEATVDARARLDAELERAADRWRLERLAVVDRNLLRLAAVRAGKRGDARPRW